MGRLSRRVARLDGRFVPQPAAEFLDFARAVIVWGERAPSEETVRDLAFALQRTGQGATWTGLVALMEADDAPDVPLVDPRRLTAAECEEAGRIRAIVDAGGLAALSDEDLDLAECLRANLDGLTKESCLG